MTLLSEIIDAESSIYEEVAKNKGKESTSSRRIMSSIEISREVHISIMQYMETSWNTRQDLQHEASHGKKAQTTKRHLQPPEVNTHDRKNHVCELKKALYNSRRNSWDNTYKKSLNITQSDADLNLCYKVEDESLQRMTSSQMGARRNFEKVQYIGSWYIVTLDRYIIYQQQRKLLITPVHNVSIRRVRKAEGE